jgi:hypothetical protein
MVILPLLPPLSFSRDFESLEDSLDVCENKRPFLEGEGVKSFFGFYRQGAR